MKRIGFQNSPVKSLCAMVFGRFIDAPNALRNVTVRKSQVSLVIGLATGKVFPG